MTKAHNEDELVALARKAARAAHAPYSGFHVGAAVESVDGAVATGSNMENACYRLGTCAEISALTSAQQQFGLAAVRRIAVSGGPMADDAIAGETLVTPCGGCRQAIAEAAALSGHDIEIVAASGDGATVRTFRISELLPESFGPDTLKTA